MNEIRLPKLKQPIMSLGQVVLITPTFDRGYPIQWRTDRFVPYRMCYVRTFEMRQNGCNQFLPAWVFEDWDFSETGSARAIGVYNEAQGRWDIHARLRYFDDDD